MTYTEGSHDLIFDDSQPLAQALATYALMRVLWAQGPTEVWLLEWSHVGGRLPYTTTTN